MKRLNNSGSHLIAILVAVVVIGGVGLAGYKVWQQNKAAAPATTPTAKTATVPASIKTQADLTAAAKVLDNSQAQLNGSLNDSNLNSDLNDLL